MNRETLNSVGTRAGRLFARAQGYAAPHLEAFSTKLEERRERREWGRSPQETGNTPKASPSLRYVAGSIGSYFSARNSRPNRAYTAESIQLVPGYATLRKSPAGRISLEVLAVGNATASRPIESASRAQKVFIALAKRLASLPPIPANLRPDGNVESEPLSVEALTANLKAAELEEELQQKSDSGVRVLESLLDIGGRENKAIPELAASVIDPEAQTPPLSSSPPNDETNEDQTILPTTSASIARRPGLPRGLSAVNMPTRRSTAPVSSISRSRPVSLHLPRAPSDGQRTPGSKAPSGSTTPIHSRPSSMYADSIHSLPLPRPAHNAWPTPFTYEPADLPRLHHNLHSRLLPFIASKLGNRNIRISIYPVTESGSLWDKPLSSIITSTNARGAFRERLIVKAVDLIKLVESGTISIETLEGKSIKIVAELLEEDILGSERSEGMEAVAYDENVALLTREDTFSIISDIDDTIKHTQVLNGTKGIFRNVFARELDEIIPPGMVDTFHALADHHHVSAFHYVSNGPTELAPTIKQFLKIAGYPLGSLTLKEYGGGSSMIAKLWEDAGNRKRAGLVAILNAFPKSQFLLIGDSGESDLQIYTTLAVERPSQIRGIFIRDVTTPFTPTEPVSTKPEKIIEHVALRLPKRSESTPFPALSLMDGSSDPLSPNNPISTPTINSEETVGLVEAFYSRLQQAEGILEPLGIPLRIFRDGKEIRADALNIVQKAANRRT